MQTNVAVTQHSINMSASSQPPCWGIYIKHTWMCEFYSCKFGNRKYPKSNGCRANQSCAAENCTPHWHLLSHFLRPCKIFKSFMPVVPTQHGKITVFKNRQYLRSSECWSGSTKIFKYVFVPLLQIAVWFNLVHQKIWSGNQVTKKHQESKASSTK